MKPEWSEAFKLDSESGPAPPLASDEAKALASKIVERALSTSGTVAGSPGRSRMLVALASAGGAIAVLGLVFAVSSKEEPTCPDGTCADRPASSAASVPVVVPAAPRGAPAPLDPAPLETVPVTALPNVAVSPASAQWSAKAVEEGARARQTPSDLLAEANRARRDREWQRAAALYERVMNSQADESYAATVALASLRLDHLGDPRGALALYERALSAWPGGALSAQAEAGAARCRRVLGDKERASP